MKVFYFNDRSISAYVYTGHDMNQDPVELKPAEGRFFDIPMSENQVPFVKVWETNLVFISGIDSD